MWRGYEPALLRYCLDACDEWARRGFRNDLVATLRQEFPHLLDAPVVLPPWLGMPELHASHRANLLRKAPDHYARHGWTDPTELPYVWPVVKGEEG